MKNVLIVIILLVSIGSRSVAQKSLMHGTTATGLPYNYAYLYDPETKILLTTSIVNREFRFELNKTDQLKILVLSFNTDFFKTYPEVKESYNFKSPYSTRMVAIEDTVEIVLQDYARYAVVKGNKFNKDIDDMHSVIKSRKFEDFFEQHADSPVAMVFLETLAEHAFRQSSYFTMQQLKESYNKLSDRLKNSETGRKLSARIAK